MKNVVADRMSHEVIVVHPGLRLAEAVLLMRLNKIRHLGIVSAAGQLVGIVSERDVSRALPSELSEDDGAEFTRALETTRVGHIMTRATTVAAPSTELWRAAQLMLENRIDALPVVERGTLLGILTTADCLSSLLPAARVADPAQSAA